MALFIDQVMTEKGKKVRWREKGKKEEKDGESGDRRQKMKSKKQKQYI